MKLSMMCVVAMLAAGCSSGETPPAETGAPAAAPAAERDACALVTAQEASTILGSTATATSRSASAERSVCDYVTQAYEAFTLEAVWSGAEEEIKIARSAAKMAAGQAGGRQDEVVRDVMGLTQVEGLGDEAYFSRRTMSYVRKGDVLLIFQNAGLNEPAREHWEALARAALARL
ncbi:MAG TPA: hypothetical protein VFZ36_02130 [Vicinamibacterales bacterium]